MLFWYVQLIYNVNIWTLLTKAVYYKILIFKISSTCLLYVLFWIMICNALDKKKDMLKHDESPPMWIRVFNVLNSQAIFQRLQVEMASLIYDWNRSL